jgi:glycosyltransferase involved in cell wall biosynthesis
MPFADPGARRCPAGAGLGEASVRRPGKPVIAHVLMTVDAVGGVWRYALDLGAALARRRIRTTLAVMGPPPDAGQRLEAQQARLPLAHRSYRLEWMDDPWQDVEQAGRWLLRLERTLHPDVVHLNGYAHAALPWCAPTVVVGHSCVRSWWRAVKREAAPERWREYSQAVSSGLNAARLVVAPTATMLGSLQDEYGITAWSRVIPNGTPAGALASEPAWESKEPMILAAGRVWDEAKNLAAVCHAAADWSWPVYVAGDQRTPDGDETRLHGVRALGRVEHERLSGWQRRASIYVSPARYEPFGLSILEAAAAGCTLVLGDIPSLRENWDGAAAFVPPDDAAALSQAVQHLIGDPAERRRLGRRAWERAGRFTIERTADDYLRAYEDVA